MRSPYFWNIISMRRVTAKPPKVLIEVSVMPITAMIRIGKSKRPAAWGGATWSKAPMVMIEEIALVTLISGVCRAGVTFHTTM